MCGLLIQSVHHFELVPAITIYDIYKYFKNEILNLPLDISRKHQGIMQHWYIKVLKLQIITFS